VLVHSPSVRGLIARLDASLPLSLIGEPGYAACIESLASGRDLNGAGQNEMALDVAHGERWSCATFLALKR
jgi:hypothetical protein